MGCVSTMPVIFRSRAREWRDLLTHRIPVAFMAYVTASWASLWIQSHTMMTTQLWPAAGIGLALVLIWGPQVVPAFFFGTLAVYWLNDDPLLPFLGAAIGNTVEPLLGAYLCGRTGDFRLQLDRLSYILRFVFGAALVSTVVGTVIAVPVIEWSGYHEVDFGYWIKFWAGNSVGVLIAAPALLVWFCKAPVTHLSPWGLSRSEVATLAVVIGCLVGSHVMSHLESGVPYLDFGLVVWAAMRLGQQGATVTSLVIALLTTLEAAQGFGHFGTIQSSVAKDFELLFFIASLQTTGLAVAAVVLQRERSRLDAALAYKLAEKANDAKTSFLMNISHEVRTPLSVLLGFSEILANEPSLPAAERARLVDGVKRNSQRISGLINDVLEVAAADSGVEPPAADMMKSLSIADLVAEISAVAREQNYGQSTNLHVETEGIDLTETFVTDPSRLRRILGIVVGNAFKFSGKGEVLAKVSKANGHVAIDIRDFGIGIAKNHQRFIYDPFWRGESSSNRNLGGIGLGLTIAKRMAHSLGGEVKLTESEHGRGSVFRITIGAAPSL